MRGATKIGALAAACLLMASCGSGSTDEGAADGASSGETGDIVVGFAIAKTGGFATFDTALLNGAQIAADDINAKGGVLGRKIKIISADTTSSIDQAAPAAESLIKDGAQFIGATSDYDFGGPAIRVATQKGLVGIAFGGDTKLGYHGISPLAFNSYPGSASEGVVMAQFAHSKGWTKPYVLIDTINSYPQTVADGFVERWKSLTGGEIAGKDLFLNSDQSIQTQILKMKSTNPDVILVSSFPPGGSSAIRQIRAAGLTQPILGVIAFDGQEWISSLNDLSDMYVPQWAIADGADTNPAVNDFFAKYERLTGKPSPLASYPASGYAQIQILAKGIEDAGTTKGEQVAAAISKLKGFETLIGPIDYAWKQQCNVPAAMPFKILQVQGGKETVLATETPSEVPPITC